MGWGWDHGCDGPELLGLPYFWRMFPPAHGKTGLLIEQFLGWPCAGLEVKRVSEFELQGTVLPAVEHSGNPALYVADVLEQGVPALVVHQEEIVSGPENIGSAGS